MTFKALLVALFFVPFKLTINLKQMKKIFGLIFLIFILGACSPIYNYKSSYHAPTILYQSEIHEHPEHWDFYMHDSHGQSSPLRSVAVDSNSFSGVILSPEPIELPEKLPRTQFHRRNEVHVFVKNQELVVDKRIKLKVSDIKEVVIYSNPKIVSAEKGDGSSSFTSFVPFMGGIIISSLIILIFIWIYSNIFDPPVGCYIATMAYGSYDAPEVKVLRKFRDEVLKKTFIGRVFIANYYAFSPLLVKFVKKTGFAEKLIRRRLDRFVIRLKQKHNW